MVPSAAMTKSQQISTTQLCGGCAAVLINRKLYDALEEAWTTSTRLGVVTAGANLESCENEKPGFETLSRDFAEIVPLNYQLEDSGPRFCKLNTLANAGCELCRFLLHYSLFAVKAPKDLVEYKILISYKGFTRSDPKCLVVEYQLPEVGMKRDIRFLVKSTSGSIVGEYLRIENLPVRDVHYITSRIKSWMDQCDANHSMTCTVNNDCAPPTRLIDLGVGSNPSPRLVDSVSGSANYKYIALSYLWGDPSQHKAPPKTVKGNIDKSKLQIELQTLPPCFQDFINIAYCLGIRYLWIDALCIIQDDKDDWEKEASRMADVYENSLVTFVAASGSSTEDGLFDRNVQGKWTKALSFESSVQQNIRGSFYLSSDYVEPYFTALRAKRDATWAQRGWTFQEGRLSPRVVFFTKDCLFFECLTHLVSDIGPREIPSEKHDINMSPLSSFSKKTEKSRQDKDDEIRSKLNSMWKGICCAYFQTRLTYPTDRLPALSGIANMFQRLLREEKYLAGLWSGSLAHELLWSMSGPKERPEHYLAPSWSWASWANATGNGCMGYLSYSPTRIDMSWFNFECETMLTGKNPYGEVSWGTLKFTEQRVLAADSIRREVDPKECSYREQCVSIYSSCQLVGFVYLDDECLIDDRVGQQALSNMPMIILPIGVQPRRLAKPMGFSNKCAELLQDMEDAFPLSFVGLALRAKLGLDSDVFERIGLVYIPQQVIVKAPWEVRTFRIV